MKSLKCIVAIIVMAGLLLYSGQVMAEEGNKCLTPSNYLRGNAVVEITIGQETLFVKPIAVPGECWALVEIEKGPNTGKKYMINLGQVSKMTK